ncbi:hypothetical protein Tco_0088456 [Tanacetum coccineum]
MVRVGGNKHLLMRIHIYEPSIEVYSIKDVSHCCRLLKKSLDGNAATKRLEESSNSRHITQDDGNHKFLRNLCTRGQRDIKLKHKHTKRSLCVPNITSSTNGVVNTALGATTVSTQANDVNSTTIDNLSNAVICGRWLCNNEGMDILEEHCEGSFHVNGKGEHKAMVCAVGTTTSNALGYNTIPPPYTGNFMPPKHDFSFSDLEEFVNEPIVSEPTVKKPIVETSESKTSEANFAARKGELVIDSGYSRHMTGNMSYLTDFEEINGGYIAFGGNLKGGKITRKEGGDSSKDSECGDQENEDNVNSTNTVNAASINKVNTVGSKTSIELSDDPNMPELEDIVYSDDDEDVGAD